MVNRAVYDQTQTTMNQHWEDEVIFWKNENKKGICLSTEYINCRTKMKWQCDKEHIWEATFKSIRTDRWCKKCVILLYKITLFCNSK